MSPELKIAWITAELTPYVKIGGLADVSSALPKALANQNQDVRIILPKYGTISDEYELVKTKYSFPDFRQQVCTIYSTKLNHSDVTIYFLDHPLFEEAPYDGELGKKFSTFSWLVTRVFDQLGWYPDVVHANDWHTGLVLPILDKIDVSTIYTIHNIAYQGVESAEFVKDIGLNYLVNDEQVNFMKMGIRYADQVTTVSKTYAEEILTPEYGFGLEEELQHHSKEVKGIVHGIDLDEYDPGKDPVISKNYTLDTIEDKRENKIALQEEANLPVDGEKFFIGMVSRLVDQKGVNLLVDILPKLAEKDLQVIVLGTGMDELERELQRLSYTFQDRISVFLKYNMDLSHKIFAGVDAFLVPSRFEPCGLTQLYSMAYGTIPIVRHTGGLADTVNEGGEQRNGFVFHDFDSEDLYEAIIRAFETYTNQKDEWYHLQKTGMTTDLSWDRPAKEWIDLYQFVLEME